MISYENQNGKRDSKGDRHWDIDVRLDGKIVGEIRRVATGYCYKPKGRKPGDVFPSVEAVKQSLEAE